MINYHVLTINEINYKLHCKSVALLIVEFPMKSYIYIYIIIIIIIIIFRTLAKKCDIYET